MFHLWIKYDWLPWSFWTYWIDQARVSCWLVDAYIKCSNEIDFCFAGFLSKIKKILECICINCGKLKVDATSDRFKRAQRIKDRKRKFHEVWDIAKGKTICDVSESSNMDDFDTSKPSAKAAHNHGGCGARQPLFRKDALKIMMIMKSSKDEVYYYYYYLTEIFF